MDYTSPSLSGLVSFSFPTIPFHFILGKQEIVPVGTSHAVRQDVSLVIPARQCGALWRRMAQLAVRKDVSLVIPAR